MENKLYWLQTTESYGSFVSMLSYSQFYHSLKQHLHIGKNLQDRSVTIFNPKNSKHGAG